MSVDIKKGKMIMTDLNKLVALCKKITKPGLMHECIYEDEKYRIVYVDHENGFKELVIFKPHLGIWTSVFSIVQQEDPEDIMIYLERILDEKKT